MPFGWGMLKVGHFYIRRYRNSMTELAESLWDELTAEAEGYFEAIELILSVSIHGGVSADDVATLFRCFHSLKGSSQMVGMVGMGALAHGAESLLALVRDGAMPLDAAVKDLLLDSVDALRRMGAESNGGRFDVTPPHSLMEILHRKAMGTAPSEPGLDHSYRDAVARLLPVIGRAATGEITDDGTLAAARQAADELRAVSGPDLLPLADAIRAALNAPGTDTIKKDTIAALARFRSELSLADQGPEGGGALDLGNHLGATVESEVRALLAAMAQCLSELSDHRSEDSDEAIAERTVGLARSACAFFLFLNLEQTSRILLMIEDIFSRVANAEIRLDMDMLALAQATIGGLTGGDGPLAHWHDLEPAATDAILEKFRQLLLSGVRGADGTALALALKHVLTEFDIGEGFLDVMSAENVDALLTAMREGNRHIHEILADLDGPEAVSAEFVRFIHGEATAITNRTVFIDGRSWFCFLVVSDLDVAGLERRIAALDPSGNHVLVLSQRVRSGEALTKSGGDKAANTNLVRVPAESLERLSAQMASIADLDRKRRDLAAASGLREAVQPLRSLAGQSDAVRRAVEAVESYLAACADLDDRLAVGFDCLLTGLDRMRMVPLGTLFNRFFRIVRDLAQNEGKQVRVEIAGADTPIDKGMIGLLADPLMHMVRNAVAHGIEPSEERGRLGKPPEGLLRLAGRRMGSRLVIELGDDGRGLDLGQIRAQAINKGYVSAADAARLSDADAARLIFTAGLSTAPEVTAIAGRGVGMDVVGTNVARLGGQIAIDTTRGRGTLFRLTFETETPACEAKL